MNGTISRTLGLLAGVALALPAPAAAQIKAGRKGGIEATRAKKTAELPTCSQPIGTLALSEPDNRWWIDLDLGSPEALLRVYAQKSGCFKLVNRSQRGMAAMQQERALASGGELRGGGAVGKGQMVEAEFTLIPDIVTANRNRGGMRIGGLLGAVVPGVGGALLGGLDVKKRSANVVLNVVNNKSSEEFVMEGSATKTDVGFGGGGGIFAGGFLGAGGASGYAESEIGQVVALAYLDAFRKLVSDLGGMEGAIGGPAPEKAVVMKNAGRMFTGPSVSSVLKPLDAGAMLYPTGNKQNGFWEVTDELGTKGWVSEVAIGVAR
ncbi:penicillin-binding protein activator LpoB [Erythrobacter sp. WG]|uniref:penicillin-binding protein activator LpoB n=1 Tax=Erythrobacter sp. WG TaxID=2985510 RepID=UPI00226DF2C4|nr:penicillin-binding protein activator LpoB [Erythrobacter sp. WG]MCX9146169.1 penicillin-binding protein activator LpoB [Erythrobacter sp. WG]